MSNVIQFCSRRQYADTPETASIALAGSAAQDKPAELCASARDAFVLLACQLELAMWHARTIEARIHDPKRRREFTDRIEFTQGLLDAAHQKIRQL